MYYKVADGNQETLLLYVDDLFGTGEGKLILDSKRKLVTKFELEDVSIMHNFLDLEVWQKPRRDYVESRKVCSGDLEGIQNDGLGIHDYADDDDLFW